MLQGFYRFDFPSEAASVTSRHCSTKIVFVMVTNNLIKDNISYERISTYIRIYIVLGVSFDSVLVSVPWPKSLFHLESENLFAYSASSS